MGVFDPGDESLQLIDISAQLSSDLKFAGAAPPAVGMIIFVPEGARVCVCIVSSTAVAMLFMPKQRDASVDQYLTTNGWHG